MVIFCTTCKGRRQHIEQTLPKNLKDNSCSNHKFVLLDYGSADGLETYLKSHHMEAIESGRLVVYTFKGPGPFRMAHAKNTAHRLGILEGGDILVNLDADNFTGVGFSDYITTQFKANGEDSFLWARMVKGDYARGISGRIVVTAKAFLLTGGYDEKYTTWSPDDKDFNARLRRLGFQGHEIDKSYLDAVMHNDKMRFKEYKHVQTDQDEERFIIQKDRSTIANFGRIGHSMVFRNFQPEPVVVGPVPTRIFGIGMHKTATTSLHHALKIMGYNSAHWKSAHWAKAIWEEMVAFGKSPTLEKSYALCDLPILLLYQALDIAYPGSKFILTTRDEDQWIQSVKNHWSYELNRFRQVWDTDPFTHKIHNELYGRKMFDAEIFLQRFRRHNAEVKEYFKDRSGDLLIMDMSILKSEKYQWNGLCRFLNQPIPSVDYPSVYITGV